VPQHAQDYVHRIGRTGRAKASGDAFTLMAAEDAKHVQAIERFIGQKIDRIKLEGFNYQYTALFDEDKDQRSQREKRTIGVRLSGGYYFGPARRRRR
jgi:ATP-dependent RNA helicase RhlE